MKSRCNNPNFPRFLDYGGRGIKVCQEWNDYQTFRDWALSHGYASHLTIERSNNDKGYSPDNCEWITRTAQARNKRNSRRLSIFGETKTLPDWADDPRCQVSYTVLRARVFHGWDAERAVTETVKQVAEAQPRLITYQGQTLSINAWAKLLGLKPAAIYARANRGLSPEEILAPVKQAAPYGSVNARKNPTH